MMNSLRTSLAIVAFAFIAVFPLRASSEQLVLDLDMDDGLLYLAHNIENFLFTGTASYSEDVAGNLSRRIETEPLTNYLVATALVMHDGAVVGMATEQEYVSVDEESGIPFAQSAWLISLNAPGMRGVLALQQTENAGPVFAAVGEVMASPEREWPDEFNRYLSTHGEVRVTTASEELVRFRGARFEEYNYINPADFRNYGRFRGRIQFVITTADED